jgi:cysteine-rich repeat protein
VVAGLEACDDLAPGESGDGCSAACTLETGWTCSGTPSVCVATCGDGLVRGNEVCDDAPPAEAGDGCSMTCQVETGWACNGAPSVCLAVCGDGLVTGAEVCDDAPAQRRAPSSPAGCVPGCLRSVSRRVVTARALEPRPATT